jgi:hypothetical protein
VDSGDEARGRLGGLPALAQDECVAGGEETEPERGAAESTFRRPRRRHP